MRGRRGRKDDRKTRSPTYITECPYQWRNIPVLRCILHAAVLSDESEMLMTLNSSVVRHLFSHCRCLNMRCECVKGIVIDCVFKISNIMILHRSLVSDRSLPTQLTLGI
jgi:hypothetical protein